MTDGKKTIEIELKKWNGSGYDPDFSLDFFDAGFLPYDFETNTHTVKDVDYCIEMAKEAIENGDFNDAFDENGDLIEEENIHIFINEIK